VRHSSSFSTLVRLAATAIIVCAAMYVTNLTSMKSLSKLRQEHAVVHSDSSKRHIQIRRVTWVKADNSQAIGNLTAKFGAGGFCSIDETGDIQEVGQGSGDGQAKYVYFSPAAATEPHCPSRSTFSLAPEELEAAQTPQAPEDFVQAR
jgi:hypothetical protein